MAKRPQNFSIFPLDKWGESKWVGSLEFVNNCNKWVFATGRVTEAFAG